MESLNEGLPMVQVRRQYSLRHLPLYSLACATSFGISAWGRFSVPSVIGAFCVAVLLSAAAELWAITRILKPRLPRGATGLPGILAAVWLGCQALVLSVVWVAAGRPSGSPFVGESVPSLGEWFIYTLVVTYIAHIDLQAWRPREPAIEAPTYK